jgi:DNA polymerase III alpha subunit (gram-positive type)
MNFNEVMEEKQPENGALVEAGTWSLEKVKPTFAEFVAIVDAKIKQAIEIEVRDEASQKSAVALVGEAKRIIKAIDSKKKELPSYREAKSFLDGLNSFATALTEKFKKIIEAADPKVVQYTTRVEFERREAERKAKEEAQKLQDELDKKAREANEKAAAEARAKAEAEAKIKREKEEAEAKERARVELAEAKKNQVKKDEIAALKKKQEEERKAAAEKAEEERLAAIKKAEEDAARIAIAAPTVVSPMMPKKDTITRTEEGVSAFTKKPWKFEVIDPDQVPRIYCSPDPGKIKDAVRMGVRVMAGVRIYEDVQMNYRS